MEVAERFWSKVNKETTSGCWEWQAAKSRYGYGVFRVTTRTGMLAHRYSFWLATGTSPKGLFVCHHCDNPPCVRPDHLFLGTQADNMKDMKEKGRQNRPTSFQQQSGERRARGSRTGGAILTEEDVRNIKRAWSFRKYTYQMLANDYGVAKGTIKQIMNGRTWKHVEA